MVRPKRRNTHLELLEAIKVWSIKHGLSEDPYIQRLSSALIENRRFSHLASISAINNLPTPKIKGRQTNLLFWLVLIRNVMIFLPVGLTWFAISQAAVAFDLFAKSNPDAIVNFLIFWQDGFGLLDSKWKLSHVAILDAVIMVLVIVLVLITTFLTRSNNRSLLGERRAIENERMNLALRIDEYLETKKSISNLSFNNEVSRMIHSLRFASESLDDSTNHLNKAVKSFVKEEQKVSIARNKKEKIY